MGDGEEANREREREGGRTAADPISWGNWALVLVFVLVWLVVLLIGLQMRHNGKGSHHRESIPPPAPHGATLVSWHLDLEKIS